MAGFVDGEGCLTISRQKRKGRPSPAYRVFISVSNTNRNVLSIFKSEYGGGIYNIHDRRKDKRGKNWSDAFDWYCPVSSSKRFIMDILPYLRLKKPQAMIILHFLTTKNGFKRTHWPGRGKGSAPLSPEEITHREWLRQEIHKLNTKGPDARKGVV